MNFDEAITAHSAWKLKLSAYLRKPDGSLKASEVAADNKCPLGLWIHGDGKKHAALPEYGVLRNAHAKFHTSAGDVVRRADSGKNVTEELVLGGASDFSRASAAVVMAIINMKSKA
jgi:methyl-accepting chemotaxis protein